MDEAAQHAIDKAAAQAAAGQTSMRFELQEAIQGQLPDLSKPIFQPKTLEILLDEQFSDDGHAKATASVQAAWRLDVDEMTRMKALVDFLEREASRCRGMLENGVKSMESNFKQQLQTQRLELDHAALMQATASTSIEAKSNHEASEHDGDAGSREQKKQSLNWSDFKPELMVSDSLQLLAEMATGLFQSGSRAAAMGIFVEDRKLLMALSFNSMGVEADKGAKRDVRRMASWEQQLEVKMASWIHHMRIALILMESERELARRIFEQHPLDADHCFINISYENMNSLLAVGEAIAVTSKGKISLALSSFLDKYQAVVSFEPSLAKLFSADLEGSVLFEKYHALVKALEDTALDAMNNFAENLKKYCSTDIAQKEKKLPEGSLSSSVTFTLPRTPRRDRLKVAFSSFFKGSSESVDGSSESICSQAALRNVDLESISCGNVDKMTRTVVHDVVQLCTEPLASVLRRILAGSSREEAQVEGSMQRLIGMVTSMLDGLKLNLKSRAATVRGDKFGDLFLMNNLDHLLRKLEGSDAEKLLGNVWIASTEKETRHYCERFTEVVIREFNKVLGDGGLGVNERFELLNSQLENLTGHLSLVTIENEKLRNHIKGTAIKSIGDKYGATLQTLRATSAQSHYSREEVEWILNSSFDMSVAGKNQ